MTLSLHASGDDETDVSIGECHWSKAVTGLGSGSALIGGGVGIATALSSDMDGFAATISTTVGANLGVPSAALKDALTAKRDIKRHRFYLLHQVDQLLKT